MDITDLPITRQLRALKLMAELATELEYLPEDLTIEESMGLLREIEKTFNYNGHILSKSGNY